MSYARRLTRQMHS